MECWIRILVKSVIVDYNVTHLVNATVFGNPMYPPIEAVFWVCIFANFTFPFSWRYFLVFSNFAVSRSKKNVCLACGDGVLDLNFGEECDGGVGCVNCSCGLGYAAQNATDCEISTFFFFFSLGFLVIDFGLSLYIFARLLVFSMMALSLLFCCFCLGCIVVRLSWCLFICLMFALVEAASYGMILTYVF